MEDVELYEIYSRLRKLSDEELKKLIIKLLEENETLKNEILIDELTQIYNRKVLNNNINYDVLVMGDIDDFKLINDKYGHKVGDKLLQEIAQSLTKILRKEDLILRYGGDEFTIFFSNCTAEDIKEKLRRFNENISNSYLNDINLTMSFGITENIIGKTLEKSLSEADKALYESKQNGKNTITIYNQKFKTKIL